jgi:hypothetical protein
MPVVAAALVPDGSWFLAWPMPARQTTWPQVCATLAEGGRLLQAARPEALVLITGRTAFPVQASDALVTAPDLRGRLAGTGSELVVPIDLELAEAVVIAAADAGAPLAPTQGPDFTLDEHSLPVLAWSTEWTQACPSLVLLVYPWTPPAQHARLMAAVTAALWQAPQRVAVLYAMVPSDPAFWTDSRYKQIEQQWKRRDARALETAFTGWEAARTVEPRLARGLGALIAGRSGKLTHYTRERVAAMTTLVALYRA